MRGQQTEANEGARATALGRYVGEGRAVQLGRQSCWRPCMSSDGQKRGVNVPGVSGVL